MDLRHKRVIITGAAKGLGAATALAFAAKGAVVSIFYNTSAREAKGLVEGIKRTDCRAFAFKADAGDLKEIQKGVKLAGESMGGIDILVNNAAVFYKTPIDDVSEEEWDRLMDVNLRAPFFFIKESLKFLRESGCGRVINIADTYGLSPAAGYLPYGVSKAGVIAMTKGLAKELAPGVLVNCICPGVINVAAKLYLERSREVALPDVAAEFTLPKSSRSSPAATDEAVSATLLKRAVNIEDVVNAVLFLAENNSMTGQAIFVDGGRTI